MNLSEEQFLYRAKKRIEAYILVESMDGDLGYVSLDTTPNVHIVWYNYTLGSMKAIFMSPDMIGILFEVTYNKDKDEVYLDVYKKVNRVKGY